MQEMGFKEFSWLYECMSSQIVHLNQNDYEKYLPKIKDPIINIQRLFQSNSAQMYVKKHFFYSNIIFTFNWKTQYKQEIPKLKIFTIYI